MESCRFSSVEEMSGLEGPPVPAEGRGLGLRRRVEGYQFRGQTWVTRRGLRQLVATHGGQACWWSQALGQVPCLTAAGESGGLKV